MTLVAEPLIEFVAERKAKILMGEADQDGRSFALTSRPLSHTSCSARGNGEGSRQEAKEVSIFVANNG